MDWDYAGKSLQRSANPAKANKVAIMRFGLTITHGDFQIWKSLSPFTPEERPSPTPRVIRCIKNVLSPDNRCAVQKVMLDGLPNGRPTIFKVDGPFAWGLETRQSFRQTSISSVRLWCELALSRRARIDLKISQDS